MPELPDVVVYLEALSRLVVGRRLERLTPGLGERNAHGAGDPQGGRTADDHGRDGVTELVDRTSIDVGELTRKSPLVDHPHRAIPPLDGGWDRVRIGLTHGFTVPTEPAQEAGPVILSEVIASRHP